MGSKKCRVCGEEKALTDFYYRKDSRRYRTECIECNQVKKRRYALENGDKLKKYREENKQKIKEYRKIYRENNKEKIKEANKKYREDVNDEKTLKHKESMKRYYENNKEKIAEKGKKYRGKNKDKIANRQKEYYIKNKEKITIQHKRYHEKNEEKEKKQKKEYNSRPEVILRKRERNRRYTLKRRLEDPIFKLNQNISKSIRCSLKFKGLSKNGRHWEDLVGYTIKELKEHLESLFVKGMTWDNYGSWHIDHILPKTFFRYTSTDDVEFKMCWRLENLQPLWAKDNMRKGNRIIRGGK